jgi:hypothetical protein
MLRAGIVLAVIGVAFFFAPVVRMEWANFGGSPDIVAWVSPSFALFQCGAFVGEVGIQVPNGGLVNAQVAFWLASSNWNCEFPHLMI